MPPTARRSRSHGSMTQSFRPSRPVRSHGANSSWSEDDDSQLWEARAEGMNWEEIHDQHFPNKSANACRKRHERLRQMKCEKEMQQGGLEFAELCSTYANLRERFWKEVQMEMGTSVKYEVLETEIFAAGHRTVLTTARSYKRQVAARNGDTMSMSTNRDYKLEPSIDSDDSLSMSISMSPDSETASLAMATTGTTYSDNETISAHAGYIIPYRQMQGLDLSLQNRTSLPISQLDHGTRYNTMQQSQPTLPQPSQGQSPQLQQSQGQSSHLQPQGLLPQGTHLSAHSLHGPLYGNTQNRSTAGMSVHNLLSPMPPDAFPSNNGFGR